MTETKEPAADVSCGRLRTLPEVGPKQFARRVEACWQVLAGSESREDAQKILTALLLKMNDKWPDSAGTVAASLPLDSTKCAVSASDILTGLSALPPFQGLSLTVAIRAVQQHIDALVRKLCVEKKVAESLGYSIGRRRWAKAGQPTEQANRGGRPSTADQPHAIAAVQALLDKFSQPCSNICKVGSDWVVTNTLTDVPAKLYLEDSSVYGSMSESTFRLILKRHLTQYKKPRRLTDYCQHCSSLDQKVMPDCKQAIDSTRSDLIAMMPSYWNLWDEYVTKSDLLFDTQPALFLQHMVHYIDRHCESKACRKHEASNFPCGCLFLRKRGSSFPQNRRVALHEKEGSLAFELRKWLKLLRSYLHHRSCKDHQHEALTQLMDNPPLGHAVLVSDWKEQETIPQSWCQTGDQFFANARMECSIFGAQLIEHAANSRHDRPVLLRNYFVVISSIIDHITLRTCQLLRLVLSKKQSPKPWTHLHLISDCGPHYRSMEALAHGLVTLCQELSIPTSVHFGCEKHFKSCIDRLFGWCRGCLQRHLDRKKDILTIDDLFQALKSGFVENQEKSGGTKVHCIFDESPVPTESLVLSSGNLKISRTYCLSAEPSRLRPEPRLFNHVFSTRPYRTEFDYSCQRGSVPTQWRRGFFGDGQKIWAKHPQPLGSQEETSLSRKYQSQQEFLPNSTLRRRHLLPDVGEELRRKKKSLDKARARANKRREFLNAKRNKSPSTSSSDSSSETSEYSTEDAG